jgi:hypothetical protein
VPVDATAVLEVAPPPPLGRDIRSLCFKAVIDFELELLRVLRERKPHRVSRFITHMSARQPGSTVVACASCGDAWPCTYSASLASELLGVTDVEERLEKLARESRSAPEAPT